MKDKHKIIIDQVGRTVLGTLVHQDEKTLTLHNPTILHVQQTQDGRLTMNFFPVLFFEFLEEGKREKNEWIYDKSSITIGSGIELKPDLINHYEEFNKPKAPAPAPTGNPKVISLDDIED
jgi:hypothetical protein